MKDLKKIRGIHGYSQKEMAEKLGVSRQLYSTFENGGIQNSCLVEKICNFFDLTPCELLGIKNLKFMPKDKKDFKCFIEKLQKEYEKWDS